jgi:hypothetical protein
MVLPVYTTHQVGYLRYYILTNLLKWYSSTNDGWWLFLFLLVNILLSPLLVVAELDRVVFDTLPVSFLFFLSLLELVDARLQRPRYDRPGGIYMIYHTLPAWTTEPFILTW